MSELSAGSERVPNVVVCVLLWIYSVLVPYYVISIFISIFFIPFGGGAMPSPKSEKYFGKLIQIEQFS